MNKEERNKFADFEYKCRELLEDLIRPIQENSDMFCDCHHGVLHTDSCMTVKLRKDLENQRNKYNELCEEFKSSSDKPQKRKLICNCGKKGTHTCNKLKFSEETPQKANSEESQ